MIRIFRAQIIARCNEVALWRQRIMDNGKITTLE
jgi:hypothetical protein